MPSAPTSSEKAREDGARGPVQPAAAPQGGGPASGGAAATRCSPWRGWGRGRGSASQGAACWAVIGAPKLLGRPLRLEPPQPSAPTTASWAAQPGAKASASLTLPGLGSREPCHYRPLTEEETEPQEWCPGGPASEEGAGTPPRRGRRTQVRPPRWAQGPCLGGRRAADLPLHTVGLCKGWGGRRGERSHQRV